MLGLPSIEPEIFAEAGEAPIDDTIEDVADVEDEDDIEDGADVEDNGVEDGDDDDDYKDTTKKKRRRKQSKKKKHTGALLRSSSVKKVTAVSKCADLSINICLSVCIYTDFY